MGRSSAKRKRIENDLIMKERQYRFWNVITKSQLKATVVLRNIGDDAIAITPQQKRVTLIACNSSLSQVIFKDEKHGHYVRKEMSEITSLHVHGLDQNLRKEFT